jgi:predicted Zn finger-like uncharacterized protein
MAESGSMHIICPHCSTSYAINSAALGATGRTVRCSRCKEVWLARPEEAIDTIALQPAMAEANHPHQETDAAEWNASVDDEDGERDAPVVDSPSIAANWRVAEQDTAWPSPADHDGDGDDDAERGGRRRAGWFGSKTGPSGRRASGKYLPGAPTICAAMGALVVALIVWRADVVRLLPQTAAFYRMVGLNVNLRGLSFRDVKVSTETVEGKPVLVIEGAIVDETSKAIDLPRLRFSVRDAKGAEIYAWNAVLEQSVLKPGDRASFKSRLASPPTEARSIDIRFFKRRDIADGSA